MTPVDISKLADCLRSAAAHEILPRFRRLGSTDVRSKSEPTDLRLDVHLRHCARESHLPDVLKNRSGMTMIGPKQRAVSSVEPRRRGPPQIATLLQLGRDDLDRVEVARTECALQRVGGADM